MGKTPFTVDELLEWLKGYEEGKVAKKTQEKEK